MSQPQTETVVGLETANDLEGKHTSRVRDLSWFSLSLFSSVQVLKSEKQVSREDIAD